MLINHHITPHHCHITSQQQPLPSVKVHRAMAVPPPTRSTELLDLDPEKPKWALLGSSEAATW